jgi:hypothetical protein
MPGSDEDAGKSLSWPLLIATTLNRPGSLAQNSVAETQPQRA